MSTRTVRPSRASRRRLVTYADLAKALEKMTEDQKCQPVMVRTAEGHYHEVSHSSIDMVKNLFDDRSLYLQLNFHGAQKND